MCVCPKAKHFVHWLIEGLGRGIEVRCLLYVNSVMWFLNCSTSDLLMVILMVCVLMRSVVECGDFFVRRYVL